MKVIIKTLANKKHELEVDSEMKVELLKEKIQTELNLGEPELQKLIYGGKVLKDGETLAASNVKENGFIVAMITKKKPAAQAAAPPAQPEPEPAVQQQSPAVQAEQAAPAMDARSASSALAQGAELEHVVQNLMGFGFERDLVLRALQASFNNPDRAAELLLSGSVPPASAHVPAQESESQMSDDAEPSQFNEAALLQMIQQNPQLGEALANQLVEQYPQLAQMLNRETLMQLLSNPAALAPLLGGAADMGPSNVVHITEEEHQAITRLEALGFPRDRVVEAYLACDKNEEIAANYLFDHGFDDEEDNDGSNNN